MIFWIESVFLINYWEIEVFFGDVFYYMGIKVELYLNCIMFFSLRSIFIGLFYLIILIILWDRKSSDDFMCMNGN